MKAFSQQKKSILIIGPIPPPYHGVSVAIKKLLDSQIKSKFVVYNVNLADRRGIQHVGKPDLFKIFLFLKNIFRTFRIIYLKKPSMAYLSISQKTIGVIRDSFFILLCLIGGCSLVLHLHGGSFRNWYERRNNLFRVYIQNILKSITRMIVLSESFKVIFEGLMPQQKITVVPNGVEDPLTSKNFYNKKKQKKSRNVTVLYLGTLLRNKGVLVLLNSVPLVIKKRPDIRFVFAGPWFDIRDKKEAQATITSHGISRAVSFTGPVDVRAKWEVLKNSDIFVFPGIQQEGQPLVVLEAMAAGLPIIYTNRGCLSDTISNLNSNFQVNTKDPDDLARKILLLAENPQMMEKLGYENRLKYESTYTDKHFISNMLKVFNSVNENLNL